MISPPSFGFQPQVIYRFKFHSPSPQRGGATEAHRGYALRLPEGCEEEVLFLNRIRHIFSAASGSDAALSSHPAMSLGLCIVVLLSCAALFCGSTFAWFTDSASCSVEQIRAADVFANLDDPAAGEEGAAADAPAPTSDVFADADAANQNASSQNSSTQGSSGQNQAGQSSNGQSSTGPDPTASSPSGEASAPSAPSNLASSAGASGGADSSNGGASSASASAEAAS